MKRCCGTPNTVTLCGCCLLQPREAHGHLHGHERLHWRGPRANAGKVQQQVRVGIMWRWLLL